MKIWWLVLGFLGAPLAALDRDEAVFLLNRAGLGATEAEIQALAPLDRNQAVDQLLAEAQIRPPALASASYPGPFQLRFPKAKSVDEANQEREVRRLDKEAFTRYQLEWLEELRTSTAPLRARMTVFWHNHFTSAYSAVRSAKAMAVQHETIQDYALGNFRAFTRAMTVDPAMMVYLNTVDNKKGKPNENYARELLELFVLGEGQYTEADVVEAARALTGLVFDPDTGRWSFVPARHEPGNKTILGRTGPWTWESLLNLVFDHQAASRWVTQKLAVEFWGAPPSEARLQALATGFRASGFALTPLVEALLKAPEFWDHREPLVRSPLEFLVAHARAVPLKPAPDKMLGLLKRLNQVPGEPLSVLGWPVGSAWIDPDSLAIRRQAVDGLVALAPRGADLTLLKSEKGQFK